jgi:hypothetical protein
MSRSGKCFVTNDARLAKQVEKGGRQTPPIMRGRQGFIRGRRANLADKPGDVGVQRVLVHPLLEQNSLVLVVRLGVVGVCKASWILLVG